MAKTPGPRSAKLPGVSSDIEDFAPSNDFWTVIEKHSGALSPESKATLTRIIERYFWDAAAEKAAVDVSLAEPRLAQLAKAATEFRVAIEALWDVEAGVGPDLTDEQREAERTLRRTASNHVEFAVNRALRESRCLSFYRGPALIPEDQIVVGQPEPARLFGAEEPPKRLVDIEVIENRLQPLSVGDAHDLASLFATACASAAVTFESFQQAKHHRLGDGWNRMIVHMMALWKSLSPQHRVTGSGNYQARPSAFEAFVNAIQFELPEQYREHTLGSEPATAGGALRGAIAKVRASLKKDCDSGDRAE